MARMLGSKPWRLKGEGNAGAVFAYLGDNIKLVKANYSTRTVSFLVALLLLSEGARHIACPPVLTRFSTWQCQVSVQIAAATLSFPASDRKCLQIGRVVKVRKVSNTASTPGSLESQIWSTLNVPGLFNSGAASPPLTFQEFFLGPLTVAA